VDITERRGSAMGTWKGKRFVAIRSASSGVAAVAIAIASVVSGGATGADSPQGGRLKLRGARVLDPAKGRYLEGMRVVVEGGRIRSVEKEGEAEDGPDGGSVLDVRGLTLVPGLIDLHTHLLLHPYDEASWDDQVLRESLELRTIRAVAAASTTVEAGFTTIRDLGTEGAGFADVALRDAVRMGIAKGPRIFASTRAIVATGCYGPMGFDPRWEVPRGAQVADGVDGVRRAVREQIAGGADWIKVYADYRRTPGGAVTATFSKEELDALVAEARSAGLPVAAHASSVEGIRRAVVAGVNSIEHGTGATREVLQLMRERGVVLVPTLAASEAIARYGGWQPGEAEPPRLQQAREMFRNALEVGVSIACGSDAGVFAHGRNEREIELMVEYGMSPANAIRAATLDAAAVLGRRDDLGRIEAGFVADVIAVRGDPLRDVRELGAPVLVIREGRIVVDRRAGSVNEGELR